MVSGEPEPYGDVILFVQPNESDPSRPTMGLWGERRTVQMPYGTLQTALCRPSEIGLAGFDALFTGAPLPMARNVAWADVERLRAALRARAAGAPSPPLAASREPAEPEAPRPLWGSDA